MTYIREDIRGTTGQDIMKINENFMNIFEKVFGDINFSDVDQVLQNNILTQWIPFQGEGNLDKNYPLVIRFFAPPNIREVKSAKLNVVAERYRMDSDVTESGGQVANGDVSLSIASGGDVSTSSASGGGFSNTYGVNQQTSYVKAWGGVQLSAITPFYQTTTFGRTTVTDNTIGQSFTFLRDDNFQSYLVPLYIKSATTLGEFLPSEGGTSKVAGIDLYQLQHTHTIPAHSHSISISPHAHNVTLSAHTHSGTAKINIDPHSHNLKEGIRVSTSNIGNTTIKINDTSICSLTSAQPIKNDIDITPYIKVGDWNIIKVETSGLARVSVYGTLEAIIKMIK